MIQNIVGSVADALGIDFAEIQNETGAVIASPAQSSAEDDQGQQKSSGTRLASVL